MGKLSFRCFLCSQLLNWAVLMVELVLSHSEEVCVWWLIRRRPEDYGNNRVGGLLLTLISVLQQAIPHAVT